MRIERKIDNRVNNFLDDPRNLPVGYRDTMAVNRAAKNSGNIKPIDSQYLFDVELLSTATATGFAFQSAITFFGYNSGGHPLGNLATNMESGGKLVNSKMFIVKDFGIDFHFTGVQTLTPADLVTINSIMSQLCFGKVWTKDSGDRRICRGQISHFAGVGNFGTNDGALIDDPTNAAPYIAHSAGFNLAPFGAGLRDRRKLDVAWILLPDSNFEVQLELPDIALGANFSGSKLKGICSMWGAMTTKVR